MFKKSKIKNKNEKTEFLFKGLRFGLRLKKNSSQNHDLKTDT